MHSLYLYDGIVYKEDGPGLFHSAYNRKEDALVVQAALLNKGIVLGYKNVLPDEER